MNEWIYIINEIHVLVNTICILFRSEDEHQLIAQYCQTLSGELALPVVSYV